MDKLAKLFFKGRNQAVLLPSAFRFESKVVYIRKDSVTGDVILSEKPSTWDEFFLAQACANIPSSFLDENERKQDEQIRDPFEGWKE